MRKDPSSRNCHTIAVGYAATRLKWSGQSSILATMRTHLWLVASLVSLAACDDGGFTPQNPTRTAYDEWQKVEIPGTVCGNGSQYKFFTNFSKTSDNLVVVFEPGGACWDYASCTGASGIRGAANPDGILDSHWELAPFISPFFQRFDDVSPTQDWNYVYVPYCTGDVHTGNNVITYSDPDGVAPDVMFHHAGHDNVQKVIEWIDANYTRVPKLLSTGCSAGGAGAITNYYFLRNGVSAAEQAYLFDDSGPIFPSTGYSMPIHNMIRAAWNTDSITAQIPGFDRDNFGSINTLLSSTFPDDRLATSFFRRDMNFSLYSYERFYGLDAVEDKDEILRMWESDTQLLVQQYAGHPNLAYYIPYWRDLNDSHCTSVITLAGSEIQAQNLTLGGWLADLLDDGRPLTSAIEAPVPGEDP